MSPDTNPHGSFRVRDAALLIGIAGLTVVVLAGCLEVTARRLFAKSGTVVWTCFSQAPGTMGIRPIPNTVCQEKMPESPLVEYRFNACGYRTLASCGEKPAGSRRVVLIGSSFVLGYQVAYEQTFGVVLQQKLTAASGRPIEVDNHGMLYGTPRTVAMHFDEALAAKPDLIVWSVSPWDVQNLSYVAAAPPLGKADQAGGPPPPKWRRFVDAIREEGIQKILLGTRSVLLVQHVLYQSPSQFLHNYLMHKDDSGALAKNIPPDWQKRWEDLDAIAKDMADRSHAAGVPFAVTAIPDRAEALMLAAGTWPPELDPLEFGEHVRSIAEKHGGVYLDIFGGFREEPGAERMYYPVDGHMDARGHALIGRSLAEQISSRLMPVLKQD
jgi:hypothetical protein